MNKIFDPYHLLVLFLITVCFQGCENKATVKTVALPPNIPETEIYTVKANGISIPVGHEVSNDSIFDTMAFMADGKVNIDIEIKGAVDTYSIHPLSKNIEANVSGNRLSFAIENPSNLLVKINDLTPLLLFSTPLEQDVPDKDDENVIFFEPGEHNVGRLKLKSNQTVYIAPGAVVYGTLEGSEVENVTIKGRGILDGSKHTTWDDRIFGIYFERSKNITIEGIGIRNCYWWVTDFLLCENVKVSHINLFSFYRNNGGLMVDGCNGFSASDSFILTNDDCICPHALNAAGNGEPMAQNYSFKNMALYNVLTGNGIRIGASFETESCRNWIFEDIDIIAHNPGASAIISDHSDWATIENLQFINFNIERSSPKLINFFIDSTRYSCFTGYKTGRGNMRRIVFKNFRAPGGEVFLAGYDSEHLIQDVWFQNFVIGGKALGSVEDINVNPFVQNVHFTDSESSLPPAPNLIAPFIETESPGELIIDNQDDRSQFVGFQTLKSSSAHNEDYHEASLPEGFSNFKAAIYEPAIKGKYEIHVYWGDHSNMATNAPWTVKHAEGYTTQYFDQNASEGWHLHGIYDLNGSSWVRLALPGYVYPTDGKVVADAVKFVKVNN